MKKGGVGWGLWKGEGELLIFWLVKLLPALYPQGGSEKRFWNPVPGNTERRTVGGLT